MKYYFDKLFRYFCCFNNYCIFCKASSLNDQLLKSVNVHNANTEDEFKLCNACGICNEYLVNTYKNPLHKGYKNKYVAMPKNINLIPEDDVYKEYEVYSCYFCHNETTNPYKNHY